jgi:hypothetical protein
LPTSVGTAILARYTNEGGVQENLDILPSITEEAYLEANPEARPARALQVMCAEGDVEGIVELLRDAAAAAAAEEEEEVVVWDSPTHTAQIVQLVCYQDPLAGMKTGLHLAIERGQVEVAWLLLWIASTLSTDFFPDQARSVAQSLQIGRLDIQLAQDIRSFMDVNGRTADQLAQRLQGPWAAFVEASVLRP